MYYSIERRWTASPFWQRRAGAESPLIDFRIDQQWQFKNLVTLRFPFPQPIGIILLAQLAGLEHRMKQTARYRFKVASEDWEFEQIHRLNYQTFVEEIPQHAANERSVLVDRFDQENEYVICLERGRVIGMLCVRDRRPFSLDGKLENLDAYLPPGRSPCELRLLAIEPEHRGETRAR